MTVKRDDLLAAATAGVLHYGEVDPLLIFLAQREATIKKMSDSETKPPRRKFSHFVYYLGGVLTIGIATLLGTMYTHVNVSSLGLIALLWFTVLYALCAIGAAAWTDMRKGVVPIGLFAVLLIALMPFAVFALEQVMAP
jgi:hypothetical protein